MKRQKSVIYVLLFTAALLTVPPRTGIPTANDAVNKAVNKQIIPSFCFLPPVTDCNKSQVGH